MCARIHILSFHLFAPRESIDNATLAALYSTACTLIELAVDFDQSSQFTEYAPIFVSRYLGLAAFIILKVARSDIKDCVDLKRGQKAYFSVILLHKKISVRTDDASSRVTMIFTQLWTSKTIFQRPDGIVDSLSLRCRGRLGMSVVYDCYWWWRQEFGGQPNPYEDANGNSNHYNLCILQRSHLLTDIN